MMGMFKLTLWSIALMAAPTGLPAYPHQIDVGGYSSPSAKRLLADDKPKPDEKGCICMEVYLPVCAALPNGKRKTFSNACFAKCEKAKVIHEGPC